MSLTVGDVFARPSTPAPWSTSRAVVDVTLELLPTVEDPLLVDLLEGLALSLADQQEQSNAVRAVLSQALALLHAERVENGRLKKRVADLLDAGRARKVAA